MSIDGVRTRNSPNLLAQIEFCWACTANEINTEKKKKRNNNCMPQIAHFNIFVHAHKNAKSVAATVAELRQQFVLSVTAVVIPL
jgi:hypothetical protein